VTGAAVQLATDANTVVFGALSGVMLVGIVFVSLTAETAPSRPGALRSLGPRIRVPGDIRREFYGGVPVLVAAWMTPALFLGLAPAVLRLHFGLDGGLVAGFTAFLGPFAAAASSFLFARHAPRRSTLVGTDLVLLGMVVVLLGVVGAWLPVLWIGAVIGGFGFGGAFGGHVRLVAPHIQDHERAGVFTGIYTVGYVAFGLPVVIAGQLAPRWGLVATWELYAAAVIALASIGVLTQAILARGDAVATLEVARTAAGAR
jgi:MFS family permease